jgi:hypothetical protein
VKSADAAGNQAVSDDFTFTTATPDTTAPVISAVSATASSAETAVNWTTNEPATTRVEYGTTTAYGTLTALDSALVTSHAAMLSGLAPNTAYHYRVRSADAAGNESVSGDFTFQTPAPPPFPLGVVGMWLFDEAAGSATAADASGSGHTGTLRNGATFGAGFAGNALSLDGTDDSVRIGRTPALEPAALSLAAWVWLDGDQAPYSTVVKKVYGNDAAAPWVSYSLAVSPEGSTNLLGFYTGHSPKLDLLQSPTALPTGRWVHVAGTYDPASGQKRLYVDGVQVASSARTAPILYDTTAAGDVYIGQDPGAGQAFRGRIDTVGIWGRALTAAEITGLTSAAAPPDTTAPVISSISTSGVGENAATVSWTTDEPADTVVEYGTTTAYGSATPLSAPLVKAHSAVLTGLSPGTVYHYRVKSRDGAGNLAVSDDQTFTTAVPPDTTPPDLSSDPTVIAGSGGATVTWWTDEEADSQVEFGTTTAYGTLTELNDAFANDHSISLSGLSPVTTYHYHVLSRDAAGNLATSRDFTFTTAPAAEPLPPVAGLSSPAVVAGAPGTPVSFTATYSDPNGSADIAYVYLRANADLPTMLDVVYFVSTNLLYLRDDSGGLAGGFAPGSPQVISNSCGSLNCAGVTVTRSEAAITVNWVLTANQCLAGSNVLYVRARDLAGNDSGYQHPSGATWTVTGDQSPAVFTVTPPTASDPVATPRTFTATYTDPDGWANLDFVYLRLNADLSTMVTAIYYVPSNRLYLRNDSGTGLIGGFAPGSANVISNAAGSLNCAAVTVTRQGNNLTVNWNLTANQILAGTNRVYVRATDRGGRDTGYRQLSDATWTITGNQAPGIVGISPASPADPAGASRVFTATYSDPDGWANLHIVWLTLNQNDPARRLQFVYCVLNNKLYIVGDDGKALIGGFAPGSANVITTPRGSVDCAATSVTRAGNTLTVNWSLTATSALAGANTVWLRAYDHGGLDTLYQQQAGVLWTVS